MYVPIFKLATVDYNSCILMSGLSETVMATGYSILHRFHMPIFKLARWQRVRFESDRVIIHLSAKRLRVEIYTRTHRVLSIRRVYHSTYKNYIKIISLMSKAQYTHAQN
jgi:hypothetical protein